MKPQSRDELVAMLTKNFLVGGKVERVELNTISELVEYHPEDMTATVEAGMLLADFQKTLRTKGQWLPIDPPGARSLNIGDLLSLDLSGPRRLGYGTIRDYLIGIKVALADGTMIKAGGKVVKNVAGYDLCKLFIGARHSLGVIVEGTFKLRPLPEVERFSISDVPSLEELETSRRSMLSSRAEPVIFDAWNFDGRISVVAAFAGNREDVAEQMDIARALGMREIDEPDHADQFARRGDAQSISVLPSRTVAVLKEIGTNDWVAHLGNGIIQYRGRKRVESQKAPGELMRRVKQAYDPKEIFPNYG